MYACRKDFQQDAAPALENSEQPAERSTTAEIEMFVDSIPDTFINRQQRVLALMTYEEIKRRNPTASNHGRPLWPATHTLPLQPNGTRLSLTPLVISQDGQHDLAAYLAVEADSVECRYWIFSPMPPDSLTSASDRDGETPDGLSTCYQDCMGCPFPCGPAPNQMDHFNCLIGCILGLSGWSPFSGQVYSTDSYWQVHVSGSTPTGGFTNQGFLNNENGTGNNTENNSGGGNGNLSNYNFTQTAYDVYDKYFDCLAANPDISTAVYNKLYTPNGTMHCLSPFIDEALGMLCEEAQGVNITAAQFEEEFERAVVRFYGIAKGIEGYVFSACGELGEVVNFALQHGLTSEQFQILFDNKILFQQLKMLTEVLDLNQDDVDMLISQPLLVAQISIFIQNHADDETAKLFAEYVIRELDTDPSIPSNTDLNQYNFFENFDPFISYLESNTETEDEINNGIEIEYIVQAPSPSPPPAGRLLGGSPANPNGGQDAIGRTNGDINILPLHIREYDLFPEWLLKSQMKFLFFMATDGDEDEILDEMGDEVKNSYLNKFFGNKNGTFHKYQNNTLHLMAKESKKFRKWLKDYGLELNERLKVTNGSIGTIENVMLSNRVRLNETKSLTILINDTQKTDVYIVNDQYDYNPASGTLEAVIRVNVTDNFGVDDGDVTEFWNYFPGGPGFVAWWILQHRKNYWPFMSDLWFSVKIKGDITP